MTNREISRLKELKELYFQDPKLLELIDLHIKTKLNDIQLAIEEGRDITMLASSVAGVNELRTILSIEPEKQKE